jgi:hypothetical protein
MLFELDIFDPNEEQIISTLRGLNKVAAYALTEYGASDEETAWKGREEELKAFSLLYPGVLFQLSVDDPTEVEFGTPVREYYKDGKMEVAFPVITYPACTL